MINFLHTYSPDPILITLGPLTVHWYGVFMVTGILLAIGIALKLAERYAISKNDVIDMVFYLVIFGIIGARLYHVFLEIEYYRAEPLNIFKVWNGGLAIHGAVIAGLAVVWVFVRKKNIDFWKMTSIIVPGLSLGQAIGRWGNYFNQEIFGTPTNAPWGIPIEPANRVFEYYNATYFHPTFLYESILNLCAFGMLIYLHHLITKKKIDFKIITLVYIVLYSAIRFSMEFIRTDATPEVLGIRWPQLLSAALIIIIIPLIIKEYKLIKTSSSFVQGGGAACQD